MFKMSEKIASCIDSNLTILIIGEAMIDQYTYGEVGGVTSEAVSFVVKHLKTTRGLGGSANIAQNIVNLGSKVHLLSLVGNDDNLPILLEEMKNHKIDFIPVITTRPTIVKHRIVARNQQILRIDYEDDSTLSESDETLLLEQIKNLNIDIYDAVILSDYNKGMFTKNVTKELFEIFKEKFILADARPKNMHLFSKASIIKCNFLEYKGFMNSLNVVVSNQNQDIEANRDILLKHFNAFLITRSEAGISYVSNEIIEHLPAFTTSVLDVTGAGDTVTSSFVLEYLQTKCIKLSLMFSMLCAKIVVSKFGCVPISKEDFLIEKRGTKSKIISSYEEVKFLAETLKKKGKTIVFTNGCYDIVHVNHAEFLIRAKKLGDVLFVAINDDASVRRYKGPDRPIIDENSRLTLISSFQPVDYVFLFYENDPKKVIELIKPDFHVKGGDYKHEENLPETETVKKCGGKVVLITLKNNNNLSTTEIIKKVIQTYENSKS
ncbi:bifunctional protein HldE isoform X1 [Hydra vulgaris]|uniref:bifunctional protein HldE isoform X1 n=1 Tax=Hydra vulgaris TaxID=6087 RepID=UPI0001923DF5|nr:bifunctional protein HldE [Hydra vulgaris]